MTNGLWARRLGLVAVLASVIAMSTGRAHAEPVRISAAARDDFGRIVFNWSSPVTHKSSVRGGRLTVRFGRPIEASYARITRTLGKYVKSASPGDDGQSVVFGLTGDFDVYSFDSGSAVIVELAEKESSGDKTTASPEAKPKPKAETKPTETGPARQNLPTIRVRAGQHADYTRLVFDWPSKVSYQFKQDGGIATLTFARAASFNLKALQSRPLQFIGGARAGVRGESSTVTLSVPSTSKLRHFPSGPKVVLDVRRPSGSEKAGPLPPPSESKETKTAAKAPEVPVEKPKASPKGDETAKDAKSSVSGQPARKTENPKTEKPKTAQIERTAVAGTVKTAAQAQTTAKAPSGDTVTPATAAKGAADSTPGSPTRLTPAPAPPSGAGTKAAPGAGPSGAAKTSLPPLPPAPSQVSVVSPAKSSGPPADAVTLRFDWNEPVGAAIFRRAGTLWVAFDKPTAIDVAQLREAGGNIIKGIEQMGTNQATVLRLSTVKGINPSVRRDGLAWLLDFRKQPINAPTPLTVKAQPDSPVGARLFVPAPEPGKPIGITDPEIGDNLVIVPLIPLGQGIGLEYVYPQVRFLPTSQGIVVKPRIDDIRVRPLREGVEVTSAGELKISAVSAEAEANRELATMKPLSRILDLHPWQVNNINSFLPRKYELLYAVSRSKGAKREAARLDLVRFYLSNGFNAEALAVLREAARDRAGIEEDPEYRMLRGASKFMLGRYIEADKDFVHDELKWIDEAAFWRASIRAAIGDITTAAPVLKRTGQIIRPYPKALKVPLGQLVADAALKIGDIKQARHFIEILRLDDLSPEEVSLLDFEEGRAMELSGDFDAAVAKWETVRDGNHKPSSHKAVIARMELLLKRKQMSRTEAIQDLEKIRFGWRGDDFEFNLLRRLGTLYIEEGLYRRGLDRLRQAATYFRTHEEAPQVTLQMSDAFTNLYLEDAADVMPPVTAIALYDEFKELTPAGAQGDEMIRKLADRLVGVDLLERTIQLLNSQVRYRLQGVEKARVGAQLTLVHILARQYTEAMKVLDETEMTGMPEALSSQRRHLRAKILMAMKQREAALGVLKDDKSRDAELLRTEVFWNTRNWSKASQSLRNLIKETGAKPGQQLNDTQMAYVLNYAIALTLSGNERALERARKDFSASMGKSRLKDAFRLITATTSLGLLDPGMVSARVKEAENFQTFMTAYRERLKKENLSDLVPGAAPPKPASKVPTTPDKKQPDAGGDGGGQPTSEQPAPQQPARPSPQA